MDHDIFWSSDHPGINFTVTSPGGNVVHSLKGTSGDKFEFKATKSGIYKFCFYNPITTPETVSFYVHVGHIPNEHDLAKDEHLDPINVKIAELREALESIITEQKFLKARDARHRHREVRLLRHMTTMSHEPSLHATVMKQSLSLVATILEQPYQPTPTSTGSTSGECSGFDFKVDGFDWFVRLEMSVRVEWMKMEGFSITKLGNI
ncbi:hypothetical protein TSUD_333880, partial [Trifolium subterraneum]